jgi:(E)-4-hydroxy-3-methylbut-2-enyl-diphosphate synthase
MMEAIDRPVIRRRDSIGVDVGAVRIGAGAPVVVQSMTNTDTADVAATVAQVEALAPRPRLRSRTSATDWWRVG